MMFKEGVININKPADWTSQDICAKLRGRLKIKKIGHTGTLDPMATGVLPVCIGKATRLIEYYDADKKTYRVSMKLGIRTDSFDSSGNIIDRADFNDITLKDVMNTINAFVGEIEQIPPKYSAIKINGRRAYELAREGKDFEIKARKIIIYSIENCDINLNEGNISFEVCCSKGTYIRTLCDDIGKKLGCFATMTELSRIQNGCFDISQSISINDLVELDDEEINSLIIPVENTLTNLGLIYINSDKYKYFINGNTLTKEEFDVKHYTKFSNVYKVYSNDAFIGIGILEHETLKPEKVVLFENN